MHQILADKWMVLAKQIFCALSQQNVIKKDPMLSSNNANLFRWNNDILA